ncbi:MAG: phosphoglucosamine mutase [Parcubacteria group bacterium]|nr:phosphoglucosamine mutase [Parcubacteria group bacterium]
MTIDRTRKLFGTDGMRGKANVVLTPDIALRLGQVAGAKFKTNKERHTVLIGKDTRRSSYMIESALVAGFTSAGMDVELTGPIPTPAVAMLTSSMRADLGVMISASHNPFEDNGIKLFNALGNKLTDQEEIEIESLMGMKIANLPTGAGLGKVKRIEGSQERYVELVKQTFPKGYSLDGLRIVVDCAHGAAYEVAPKVLSELGAEVIAIGVSPNGLNINDKCGSTEPASIIQKVREVRADIGIALDGDADRVLIVDETGTMIDGDHLLAAIATSWGKERLGGSKLVGTVLSNLAFEQYLARIGIELIRAKVGDRYVLEEMRTASCKLGGEESGHIILSDYVTTGDGLIAALQLLAIARERKETISRVTHLYESFPQAKRNIVADRSRLTEVKIIEAISEAEKHLGTDGRLVVRPSGTESVIRLMAEGRDRLQIDQVIEKLVQAF